MLDYLSGDPAHGYRVPLTRTEDKIEITTEKELVEKDVEIQSVVREKNGVYRIQVRTSGKIRSERNLPMERRASP